MKKTTPQMAFQGVNGWGGKRRKAGRKNRTEQVNHMKRERVTAKTPLLLTLKMANSKLNLRCRVVTHEFKRCAARAKSYGLRILHYSTQRDHLHLICEAEDNAQVSRGMKSFGSSFGKALRKIFGGNGPVFKGRFHSRLITNPTQMRNVLAYVLQNFSKHSGLLKHIDEFSSAPYFRDWKKLLGRKMGPILESGAAGRAPPLPDYLCVAKSWLAREGWARIKAT